MNPYEILQVNKEATLKEIKKAFKRLTNIHPPDNAKNEEFKKIYGAYQILLNSHKWKELNNKNYKNIKITKDKNL
jgi:DnaJ-class molecular chaperone